MGYIYYANIESDPNGGFIATFPDVPEAITAGDDMPETLANAAQALGLALRSYYAAGKPLPPAKICEGTAIALDAWNSLKLAVITAFEESNITKTELARRLGKQENEARRILDWNYPTKLQTLERALAVMGKQLIVTVQDKPRRAA